MEEGGDVRGKEEEDEGGGRWRRGRRSSKEDPWIELTQKMIFVFKLGFTEHMIDSPKLNMFVVFLN